MYPEVGLLHHIWSFLMITVLTGRCDICACVFHYYIMEYYSAMRETEILPFATIWIDFKDIILTEINQRKTNIV